jgi:hypothetical protein
VLPMVVPPHESGLPRNLDSMLRRDDLDHTTREKLEEGTASAGFVLRSATF